MAGEFYQERFVMVRWGFLPFITTTVAKIVVNLYVLFLPAE